MTYGGAAYSLKKMADGNVWEEIFGTFAPSNEQICAIQLVPNGNFATRLAILLSPYSEGEKQAILDSLRLSNDEKKTVLRLCNVKNFPSPEGNNDKWARHFLHLYENILHDALDVLSVWLKNEEFEPFKEAVLSEKAQKRPLRISDLAVNGDDLIPLCNQNRALVGKTLSALLVLVIDSPELNEKSVLMSKAEEIIQEFK